MRRVRQVRQWCATGAGVRCSRDLAFQRVRRCRVRIGWRAGRGDAWQNAIVADLRTDILERAERDRVKFMRLQFTDILGAIKNVEVPDRQFAEALDGRIMFDGSSIEGFVRIEESDMYLRPDLSTFQVFPWTRRQRRRASAGSSATSPTRRHAVRRLSAHDAEARHCPGRASAASR